jgi:anthranilate phosphoribosyltransferase
MSEFPALLRALVARRDVSPEEMAGAIGAIMDGEWTAAQAGAFLAALASKGETAPEVIGAARAMRERSLHVEHQLPMVADVCGTGGDNAQTINVSTCVGFVVAGGGVPVAKHGNRAASSKCGSADVLEALGVRIDAPPEDASLRLTLEGFAFLFAQRYHPAMKVVAPMRRELGVRTVFNVLGPLTNPAQATHQVIGVASEPHLELVGEALRGLGARAGAVVHSTSGIDEVAGDAPTHVYQFGAGGTRRYLLDPADFDVRAPQEAIAGGDAAQNGAALRDILSGERSPRADVIALNAALAFVVTERAATLLEGLGVARDSISSGAALAVFEAARRPIPQTSEPSRRGEAEAV